ncbi:MAG: hypothetical protein AAGU14_04110 [Eubacteriaceae bacterium]
MNSTILYEAQAAHGFSIPFIIMVLVFIIILILAIINAINNKEARIIARIGPFLFDAIILFSIIIALYNGYDMKIKVWDEYIKGNYLVA